MCDGAVNIGVQVGPHLLTFFPLLLEGKNEVGSGGSEPTMQGTAYYLNYVFNTLSLCDDVLRKSSLPCIVVALTGSQLKICGAVTVLANSADNENFVPFHLVDTLAVIDLSCRPDDSAVRMVKGGGGGGIRNTMKEYSDSN